MRHHPDTFEIRLDRDDYSSRTILQLRSHRYDVRYNLQVRDAWGDPRPLAEFCERLVGGTMRAWEAADVSPQTGHDMAVALMPLWEREIHRYMEHLERRSRYVDPRDLIYGGRRPRDDRIDALRYSMMNDPTHWWTGTTPEDPKAKEKARQLLLRNLDAGQEKSFKKDGSFRVTAKDSKVYTIKTARSFNVVAEDGTKYCGQTVDTPVEDQMLAQKLLLEHEPEKFFKNANVSPAPGADITGNEINMRYNQMLDMVNLRPGAIVRWDGNI